MLVILYLLINSLESTSSTPSSPFPPHLFVVCVCVCMRTCVRASVRARARVCVRLCKIYNSVNTRCAYQPHTIVVYPPHPFEIIIKSRKDLKNFYIVFSVIIII